jgi:hypothetical protein
VVASKRRAVSAAMAATLVLTASCKGDPDATPWCSVAADKALSDGLDASAPATDAGAPRAPTWFEDVKPLIDARCTRCHTAGGIGPFPLEKWDDAYHAMDAIRPAVISRHMPPWHAARCCAEYHDDGSLTDDQIQTIVRWIDAGGPIGDPRREPPPLPRVGGLSRVDVTLQIPRPYLPAPADGVDEQRCFLMPWPIAEKRFITGMNPLPGERTVVHHLIVGALSGDTLDDARSLDGKDGRPGFDCNALKGMGLRDLKVLGGSLVGSDYPDGLGTEVEGGSTILLQIHYSVANATAVPDQTKIEFRVDDQARPFKGMAIANLGWMVGGGMTIKAGDKDAVYFYRYHPTLFTAGKDVRLRSVTPHMHAFGSKIVIRVIHEDGSRECLLEIPQWHFGWEQPFWFAQPKPFSKSDELYIECHFDNSITHQPNGGAPRDIGWGDSNQDMCAGFASFTEGSD